MWFRRRRSVEVQLLALDESVRLLGPERPVVRQAEVPALRVERYVSMLAVHAAQQDDRLSQLERRLEAQREDLLDLPTHGDLLEARLQAGRVSAELGRLGLELRSEVAEIKDEADRAAAVLPGVDDLGPEELVELAERLLELADRRDADRRRAAS